MRYEGDIHLPELPRAGKAMEHVNSSLRYEEEELLCKIRPELTKKLQSHDWISSRRLSLEFDCGEMGRPFGDDALKALAACIKQGIEGAGYTEVTTNLSRGARKPLPHVTIWQGCSTFDDRMCYFCMLCPLLELLCLPRALFRKWKRDTIRERNEENVKRLTLYVSCSLPPFDVRQA
jgi:hypothetical protein